MNKSESNAERIEYIIQMLSEMDVDGETMEYIIKQVGMEDQMRKQLQGDYNIDRFEVINHGKNILPFGRVLTLYKELSDFSNIELSYQDNNKTLKVFLG